MLLAAFPQLARPSAQQTQLYARPLRDRAKRVRAFQFDCALHGRRVETLAAHEVHHRPHAQRRAEQWSGAKPLGVGHGLLNTVVGLGRSTGVEEGVGQAEQDEHAQPDVGAALVSCILK